MIDPDEFEAATGISLSDYEALDASAITPEVFARWRAPVFGTANPERMNNPLWEWMIRTCVDPYCVKEKFNGPSSRSAGPAWCFDRMGQPFTRLPDGRVIFIAGEHEDWDDPDFYIYNDVVVWHPDGTLDIWGYPKEVFPPADFHTATLLDQTIVIIGNLGYGADRKPGHTQIAVLDLNDFSVRMITATGPCPGWLNRHKAKLSEDGRSIVVRKGLVDRVREDDQRLHDNIDDWRLWLDEWRWERLTDRRWLRREFLRKDGEQLQLWDLRILFSVTKLKEAGLNTEPKAIECLFHPDVPHESIPESEEFEDEYPYKVTRIRVDGVVVRYVDRRDHIQMTVEGDLPPATVEALSADLLSKLEKLQNSPCERKAIE